jgi:hypothetical protein
VSVKTALSLLPCDPRPVPGREVVRNVYGAPREVGVTKRPTDGVDVPLHCPTSTIYTDDSGVKAAGSHILVIGGIKIRRHGQLMRAIRHVREEADFRREFKFTGITRGSLSAYFALIDQLEKSDAHIVATVTQRPVGENAANWTFYAEVTTRLLRGNINRNELVTVMMDMVSTPRNVAFEDVVKGKINKRLGALRVTTAACLDSRSSDGLQVADMVASAIAFERRRVAGESGSANSNKARVVNRLKEAFGGIDLMDGRTDRVNIQTWKPTPARLHVVAGDKKAS